MVPSKFKVFIVLTTLVGSDREEVVATGERPDKLVLDASEKKHWKLEYIFDKHLFIFIRRTSVARQMQFKQ